MKQAKINISGIPYFPGEAVAKLQRGTDGDITHRIILISPAEITSIHTPPAGVIVVEAAPFSHNTITLLGLGVPTVFISAQQANLLEGAMTLRIDGVSGQITDDLGNTSSPLASSVESRTTAKDQTALTADGEPITLYASVRTAAAAKLAAQLGAQAIGLVRTEFLLPPNGHIPDLEFYRRAFRAICEAAAPLPVTFRLLDVATDKIPDWFLHRDAVGRPLGLQGVRLYHLDPVAKVIDAQLTALAELAKEFPLRVLIPFLVRVEEYTYWRVRIRQQIPAHVPVGAMAETPATLLDIAGLLQQADFVAIGCNDLMQNLFAADRDLAELRHYLDPYAPLLFRLLQQVAEQAGEHLQQIQLCGVLSQMQGVLAVLLGLGYRTFSVDAPFISSLANIIAGVTIPTCEKLAGRVCAASTTEEVLTILQLPTDRHAPYSDS